MSADLCKSGEVHMEHGPVGRTLIIFTLPLLLSQIFQQFYSMADSMVIGHFAGDHGLAAVGEAALVLSVVINFFIGFSTGISTITAHLFGSYQYKALKRLISTSLLLGSMMGTLLTISGILGTETFLLWLNCPADVLLPAKQYLKICFLGIVPQLLYNTGNAVLRSLGNTKEPLVYLLISSFLNLVLDIALVAGASAGLCGAAAATVISQWLLAGLIVWKLLHLNAAYCVEPEWKLTTFSDCKKICSAGFPSGMQAVFMSLSSLVLQTFINQFGSAAVAGMVLYARVEGFLYYPAFAYGMALTGFIGQNLGAGRLDRIQEAMKKSVLIAAGFTIPASLLLTAGSGHLLLCFTSDPDILFYGSEAIFYILPWYFLYAVVQVCIGGLKGLGKTGYPMICSLICYCLFRIIWCQSLLSIWWDMRVIYQSYNVSLLLMLILLITHYRSTYRKIRDKNFYP
ncbi:MATE family efflux transporter [Ruminococcus sp. OA3]|uniref:MATE family efflux transporter n=1 Tax=Ruminococcus sp. OA3 TaxID=2914164 RepID=UPI001F05CA09|nr:MATE family efflux transporter [Ruminococcus sp. OA3]MCH1984076.1 MATE family efflux transporter [Ruminococcus sp. OA3]